MQLIRLNTNWTLTASGCDWLAPSKLLPRQPLPFPRSAARNRTDKRMRTTDGDANFTCRARWRERESHRVFSQRAWARSAAERGRNAVVELKQVPLRYRGPVTFRPPPCGSLVRSHMKTSCTRLMPSRSRSPAGCPRAATMNKCPVQWSRYVKCASIRCSLFGDRTTRHGRPGVKTMM